MLQDSNKQDLEKNPQNIWFLNKLKSVISNQFKLAPYNNKMHLGTLISPAGSNMSKNGGFKHHNLYGN